MNSFIVSWWAFHSLALSCSSLRDVILLDRSEMNLDRPICHPHRTLHPLDLQIKSRLSSGKLLELMIFRRASSNLRPRVLQYRDAKGVILLDILPQGQCINAARYCSTLDRLKEAICRKRPELLRRGVVLQHDNATPHSANLTQQWLQRYGWEILPHPAHSPDLAPSDFHLFGPLKRHLGGMAFETEDDLISELRNWFDNLDVDFFRVGIN
ncbi:histone-lysine N-methyltransferase SETMAR [Plakobranchus ocellatus]|uniref:Histone-lysine N-methyltransferase SETMAR n=1 Tax=Plakobranchus ocellatus TaxID=259542 RepID=A0AAV4CZQ9_9GAST|nr:histone-lysine N-methyltransferase SETMAR [Plakobranchus ocellatus]